MLKSIAHNGNQHVEHGDLRNECCHHEKHVAKPCLGPFNELIQLELAERKQVLIDYDVKKPERRDIINQFSFFIRAINIEHDHGDSKDQKADDH